MSISRCEISISSLENTITQSETIISLGENTISSIETYVQSPNFRTLGFNSEFKIHLEIR